MKKNCDYSGIVLIVILIAPTLISSQNDQQNQGQDSELSLVQLIFRHGDRNPIDPYPNDPYIDEKHWPEGFGQLTKIGKMQQYNLGRYIRSRYNNFISPDYSPYEIKIKSSDVDRAIMSAEANLAGLFPPNDPTSVWNWNDDIFWQPIPVHSYPENIDRWIKMSSLCPRYDQAANEFYNSTFMKKLNEENKALYAYLSENAGRVVDTPLEVDYLYDILHIETLYNYTLPNWTKAVFPDKMAYLTAFSFKMETYTEEMKRLKAGPLLGEIIENMKNKTEGHIDTRLKMFMYSGHDTTVGALLNTLDVLDLQVIPYAVLIMIELHKEIPSNKYFVKVLYRNDTERDPYLMQIPNCEFPCYLESFINLTKSKIPEDWDKECRSTFQIYDFIGFAMGALLLASLLTLIILASLIILPWMRGKKIREQNKTYPYFHLQMEDEEA